MHGIDAYSWLTEVLHRIADHLVNKVAALPPHRYKSRRPCKGAKNNTLSSTFINTQADIQGLVEQAGDGKKFYGVDFSGGLKVIIGIDINFKIGLRL